MRKLGKMTLNDFRLGNTYAVCIIGLTFVLNQSSVTCENDRRIHLKLWYNNTNTSTYQGTVWPCEGMQRFIRLIQIAILPSHYDTCSCLLRTTYETLSDVLLKFNNRGVNLTANSTITMSIEETSNNPRQPYSLSITTSTGTRSFNFPQNISVAGGTAFLDLRCNKSDVLSFNVSQLMKPTITYTTTTWTTVTDHQTIAVSHNGLVTATQHGSDVSMYKHSTTKTTVMGSSDQERSKAENNKKRGIDITIIVLPVLAFVLLFGLALVIVFVVRRQLGLSKKGNEQLESSAIVYADINMKSLAPRDPDIVKQEEEAAKARIQSHQSELTYADLNFVQENSKAITERNSCADTDQPAGPFSPYEDVEITGRQFSDITSPYADVNMMSSHNDIEKTSSCNDLGKERMTAATERNTQNNPMAIYATVIKKKDRIV